MHHNYVYKTLMRTWAKCRLELITLQSPVRSFIHHFKFRIAAKCSDFSQWKEREMDRFYKLYPNGKMVAKQLAISKLK